MNACTISYSNNIFFIVVTHLQEYLFFFNTDLQGVSRSDLYILKRGDAFVAYSCLAFCSVIIAVLYLYVTTTYFLVLWFKAAST